MAFTQVKAPQNIAIKNYNVDFGVGDGQKNLKDDVMLVQKLLSILFYETGDFASKGIPRLNDIPSIAIDGKYGQVTRRYIIHFKNVMREFGGASVYPDAIVLPYGPDPNAFSAVTHTFFTLQHMIRQARKADASLYNGLPFRVAEPLRSRLFETKGRAAGFQPGT